MNRNRNDYTNRSIAQAAAILEAVADAREPITVTEAMRATGLKQDFTFRAMQTMEDCGWLQRIGDRYQLGMKLALFWARRKSGLEAERDRIDRDIQSLEEVA